jgi:DNA-binding Lrp family transcriptional regulator
MTLRGIDETDIRILQALQEDGRMHNKNIAARAGIAPSTCLDRLRRLRSEGVLLGVRPEVSPTALGAGLEAMVRVQLDRPSRAQAMALREYLLDLPEVVTLYEVAERVGFLLHVAVRNPAHLQATLYDALGSRPEVAALETALLLGMERCEAPIYRGPDHLVEQPRRTLAPGSQP